MICSQPLSAQSANKDPALTKPNAAYLPERRQTTYKASHPNAKCSNKNSVILICGPGYLLCTAGGGGNVVGKPLQLHGQAALSSTNVLNDFSQKLRVPRDSGFRH